MRQISMRAGIPVSLAEACMLLTLGYGSCVLVRCVPERARVCINLLMLWPFG